MDIIWGSSWKGKIQWEIIRRVESFYSNESRKFFNGHKLSIT